MYSNISFPSLKGYLELIKAFQRSLLPPSLFSTFEQPVSLTNFKFATGISEKQTLSAAIVECINQVQQKLGHGVRPDLCQLLVTTEPYGRHFSLAPSYVHEIFDTYGLQPPVIFGGAVEGLIGVRSTVEPRSAYGEQLRLEPGLGVSLMAARLPGVTLHPFHTEGTSLPELPWQELLKVGISGPAKEHSTAALVLSEPHFTQVAELLERMQSAMPKMATLGGVLRQNAWGDQAGWAKSMRGALFLNGQVHDSGAVGCILSGPMKVDTMCAHGCRPLGQIMEVTDIATDGQSTYIFKLDYDAAVLQVDKCLKSMDARSRMLPVQLGVDISGTGHNFVHIPIKQGRMGTLNAGSLRVEKGSLVQVFVQDHDWAQQHIAKELKKFAEELPEDIKRSPEKLGAFLYSCTTVRHKELSSLESALQMRFPSFAFQGTKVQGEFGRNGGAWNSNEQHSNCLQSYSSSFGILRQIPSFFARHFGYLNKLKKSVELRTNKSHKEPVRKAVDMELSNLSTPTHSRGNSMCSEASED